MAVPVVFGPGFYEEESTLGRPHRWTGTRASLTLAPAAGDRRRTEFQADVSTQGVPRSVQVRLAGRTLARFSVAPNRSTHIDVSVPVTRFNTLTFIASPRARIYVPGGRQLALSFANVSAQPVLTTPDIVSNGSFEVSTAGWGVAAPNTFVRTTRLAEAGRASGLATRDSQTADTDVANFRMVLTAGKTYAFSCWIYVPPSYSGVGVQPNAEWVGASGTTAVADMAIRDQWQHTSGIFTLGSTTAGYFVLRLPGAKTGDFVYLDDVKTQAVS